jgi:asparagine synthase (glutamine-hydrolysing)
MPGIVGLIRKKPANPRESQAQLAQMLAIMRHEPSYILEQHDFPDLGIYAGLVAHEGSFAGRVFRNKQRGLALFLSGECFLDSETHALLQRRGYADGPRAGDWLLPLYLERCDRFFEELNGLFSGLLVDQQLRKAFLFNDRYGLERLYWHENDHAIYFASEAKALLRILPELREFNKEGVLDYLKLGCTICPRTLFKGIESAPPASLWCFQGGHCRRSKYFEFQKWEGLASCSAAEFPAAFEATFRRILPRYVQANEEIGVSLTAGLDGRLIMACLPERGIRPVCYTYAGPQQNLLDAQIAAKVAAACGFEHHVLRIDQDFFNNFSLHADRAVYLTDGCLGLLGTHEAYFSKRARNLALTRLTGVFGGEIFREVSFYKPIDFDHDLLNPDWRGWLQNRGANHTGEKVHPITTAVTREIPDRRFGVVAAGRWQTVFRTPYLDNELVALAYRTPPALRASPQPVIAAINDNSKVLSHIPTDMGLLGKGDGIASSFRRIFGKATFKLDYFYSECLPKRFRALTPVLDLLEPGGALFGRHKFLHYRRWFQRELAPFVGEKIRGISAYGSELWSAAYLHKMMTQYARRGVNYSREISLVLTLEAVERLFFQGFQGEAAEPLRANFERVKQGAS